MRLSFFLVFISLLTFFVMSQTVAQESLQYQQRKLPDGSTELIYMQSNGAKMRQVQYPNGVIETHMTDEKGNETITTKQADGRIETKTIKSGTQ